MIPLGTVITRFRWPASITTYAVITLVTLPIGRFVAGDRVHRTAPVVAFASSAHGAATAAGPFAAWLAWPRTGCACAAAPVAVIRPAASSTAAAIALVSRLKTRICPPIPFPNEYTRILSAGLRLRYKYERISCPTGPVAAVQGHRQSRRFDGRHRHAGLACCETRKGS